MVKGYNLRENFNIYASAAIGIIAPIPLIRYGIFDTASKDVVEELTKWGLSILIAGPFPLATGIIGLSYGFNCADELREERKNKSHLEDNLDGIYIITNDEPTWYQK